ncbi:UNVERIFIED_CONTAM: hypothetical protein K2H54_038794 [Gekko kuhli]
MSWYRGYTLRKKSKKGIFPASYIQLKEAIVEGKGQHETVIPSELPLIQEVTTTLREWSTIWRQLYVVSSFLIEFGGGLVPKAAGNPGHSPALITCLHLRRSSKAGQAYKKEGGVIIHLSSADEMSLIIWAHQSGTLLLEPRNEACS